jgi:hypothetical protein
MVPQEWHVISISLTATVMLSSSCQAVFTFEVGLIGEVKYMAMGHGCYSDSAKLSSNTDNLKY